MKDKFSNFLNSVVILMAFSLLVGCKADSSSEAETQSSSAVAQATAGKNVETNESITAEKEAAAQAAKRLKDEQRLEELKAAKKELEDKAAQEKLAEEKEARAKKRRAAKREKEKLLAEEKIAQAAKKDREAVATESTISSGKGKLGFEQPTFNFGKVDQGDRVNHEFKFFNTGTQAINVTNVTASCGCTRPSYPFLPIEPGKSGVIGVTFDTKGKLGRQKPSLTINTDGDPGEYKIFLEGFVDSGSKKN